MTKSRHLRPPYKAWLTTEVALLRREFADKPTAVLAYRLGRSYQSVQHMAGTLGLHKSAQFLCSPHAARFNGVTGATSRFRSGLTPWNKGLHYQPGGDRRTQYKPGQISGRAAQLVMPIGAYRINSDGVLERKVAHTPGPGWRRWQPVSRIVWEAAHGPVPAGHLVVFRQGRRTTELARITLDALDLVTRAQLMQRNSFHRYGPELASAVQLCGALMRQINRATTQPEHTP